MPGSKPIDTHMEPKIQLDGADSKECEDKSSGILLEN